MYHLNKATIIRSIFPKKFLVLLCAQNIYASVIDVYKRQAIRTNELSKSVMTNMVPTIIKEGTREVTTSRNAVSYTHL